MLIKEDQPGREAVCERQNQGSGPPGALITGDPEHTAASPPAPRTSSAPLTLLLRPPGQQLQGTVCHPL